MVFYKTAALVSTLLLTTGISFAQSWADHTTSDGSLIVQRHEAASTVSGDQLYVLGGRGIRPFQVFDATENRWLTLSSLPQEMHHFQPVALNGYIYAIGAFTCCFPDEPTIAEIYRLNIQTNTWETFGAIPNDRLRGGAGAIAYNNKIYFIGGNTNGHSGGAVGWFDEFDPATGNWRTLPDAPNARDHFSAVIAADKLIAASGRQSNRSFGGTVAATDIYDFSTNQWTTVESIPTPRAGAMVGVKNGNVIVIGGESDTQPEAHNEVEAYNVASNQWRSLPPLNEGRHGGGSGVIGDILHAISGNLKRGGGQEVTTHEVLNLRDSNNDGYFDFEVPPAEENEESNNNATLDTDNDGLTDQQEAELQTDPNNADSDGDTLSDGQEVNQHQSNPLLADTDSDGILDNEEIQLGTDLSHTDSDRDGLSDFDEVNVHQTSPTNNDSDNDGLTDSEELLIHNTNPNVPDIDGGDTSDEVENSEGPDVDNTDEDRDGILDSAEGTIDTDGDFIPDYIDLDSDNDGISDVRENGRSDVDNDGKLDAADQTPANGNLIDTDADGIPNFRDLDSDQDSATDLMEAGHTDATGTGKVSLADFIDINGNGWHDDFEATPVPDTDADSTPDYLDLDKNDNGITDLVENGFLDIDSNGIIVDFIDSNNDGLHDDISSLERIDPEPQEQEEPKNTVNSSSQSSGGGSAPSLPLVLLLILLIPFTRRK